jgi:hypothetical protein
MTVVVIALAVRRMMGVNLDRAIVTEATMVVATAPAVIFIALVSLAATALVVMTGAVTALAARTIALVSLDQVIVREAMMAAVTAPVAMPISLVNSVFLKLKRQSVGKYRISTRRADIRYTQ